MVVEIILVEVEVIEIVIEGFLIEIEIEAVVIEEVQVKRYLAAVDPEMKIERLMVEVRKKY